MSYSEERVNQNQQLQFPIAFWDRVPVHEILCLTAGHARAFTRSARRRHRPTQSRQLQSAGGRDSPIQPANPTKSGGPSTLDPPTLADSKSKTVAASSIQPVSSTPSSSSSSSSSVQRVRRDGHFIITGSLTGGLVLWRPPLPTAGGAMTTTTATTAKGVNDFTGDFEPCALLVRESAAMCTALSPCFYGDRSAVVAACADGRLHIWDCWGGRCFAALRLLPQQFLATSIHNYGRRNEMIVVCGTSSSALAVDLQSKTVISALEHRDEVVSATVVQEDTTEQPKDPIFKSPMKIRCYYLVALTTGGMIVTHLLAKYYIGDYPPGVSSSAASAVAAAIARHEVTRPELQSEVHITTIVGTTRLPSLPVGMAVSEDSKRLLVVMQYHWFVCSFTDYQMEFPMLSCKELKSVVVDMSPQSRCYSELQQKVAASFQTRAHTDSTTSSHSTVADEKKHVDITEDTPLFPRSIEIPSASPTAGRIKGGSGSPYMRPIDDSATEDSDDESPEVSLLLASFLRGWRGCNFLSNSVVAIWTDTGEVYLWRLRARRDDTDQPHQDEVQREHHRRLSEPALTRSSSATYKYTGRTPHLMAKLPAAELQQQRVTCVQAKGRMIFRGTKGGQVERFLLHTKTHGPDADDEHAAAILNGHGADLMLSALPVLAVESAFRSAQPQQVQKEIHREVTGGTKDAAAAADQHTKEKSEFVRADPKNKQLAGGASTTMRFPSWAQEMDANNPVTASVMLKYKAAKEILILARGFQNGTIIINSLLSNRLHVEVHTHHSAITTMLAVPIEESPLFAPLLITASADCAIRLWVLVTGQLLGTIHGPAPSYSLFRPSFSTKSSQPGGAGTVAANGKTKAKDKRAAKKSNKKKGVDDTPPQPQSTQSAPADAQARSAAVKLAPSPIRPFLLPAHDDEKGSSGSASSASSTTTTRRRSKGVGGSNPPELQLTVPAASSSADDTGKTRLVRSLSQLWSAQFKASGWQAGSSKDLLFGVDQYNTLSVYSLAGMHCLQTFRGHDSAIVAVFRNEWCELADYVITHTAQGSVYIWVLSTGHLERRLTGAESVLFLKARQLRYSHALAQKFIPAVRRGGSKHAHPLIHVIPFSNSLTNRATSLHVNVFILNVHRLLDELHDKYAKLASLKTEADFTRAESEDYDLQAYNGMLSYLFEWGADPSIDSLLVNQLGLHVPSPAPCFAFLSERSQALTILFPSHCGVKGRWEMHSRLTAAHALALSTVCMSLLNSGHHSQQVYYSRVVAHYSVILPDTLPSYVEPSVHFLAGYCLNEHEEVHTAARLLLQGTIERLSPLRKQQLLRQWAGVFTSESKSKDSANMSPSSSPSARMTAAQKLWRDNLKMMASLVLCLVAVHEHKELTGSPRSSPPPQRPILPAAVCAAITRTIVGNLHKVSGPLGGDHSAKDASSRKQPRRSGQGKGGTQVQSPELVKQALAAELLGKGFALWKRYIKDLTALMRLLHELSTHKASLLSQACHRALLQTGVHAPKNFVSCMGREALDPSNSSRNRQTALLAVVTLVKKYPHALAQPDVLALAVELITRCLDPSEPHVRKVLLQPSTMALHVLVKKYPMVDFHQKNQLYAVGTAPPQSLVIIYDLRTATKWRILEGHTGTVSAVSFSPNGDAVVSYSPDEKPAPTLRSWKIASSGFFSGILSIQGQASRHYKLAPQERKYDINERLKNVRITWSTPTSATLHREDRSVYNIEV